MIWQNYVVVFGLAILALLGSSLMFIAMWADFGLGRAMLISGAVVFFFYCLYASLT